MKALSAVLFLLVLAGAVRAQSDGFDPEVLALTYHRVTAQAIDTRSIAAQSQAAQSATGFDRPDVIAAEQAGLDARLASMDPAREFTITIDDRVTEYDRTAGQFAIELFTPGYYIPVRAYGQEYRIVFANAGSARAIPMPIDAAREFDATLSRSGRQVNNEIHFRVIGNGDPTGAVTGPLVVRAELLTVRLLDRTGQVLFTPTVTAADDAPPFAGFDASKADVAGLRVGVSAREMEATLTRLFGTVTPGHLSSDRGFKGFAGALEVNSMGCTSTFGRKKRPQPGDVCVTAYFDGREIVRMVRIQRVFPPRFDTDVFTKALVQKYGPATGGRSRTAWGPGVPGAVLNSPGTFVDALTASAEADRDVSFAGANRLENIVVSLQLIDAPWASQFGQ